MKTLYGLVLAGGKSLRMGTDKSLLNYHGKSQREVMFDMLSGYCSVVYLSVNQNQNTYLPHIIDETEAAGPLGGIVSAFEKHPDVSWLVVACDMPFLTKKSIELLVQNRNADKMATVFQNPETLQLEPLIAIYEPAIFPILKQNIENGMRSPQRILEGLEIEGLDIVDFKEFRNVNSKEEFIIL